MISNWRNNNINPNQKPKWKTTKIDHVLDLPDLLVTFHSVTERRRNNC